MSERTVEVPVEDLKGIVESALSACCQRDSVEVARSICELASLPAPIWSDWATDWVPAWDGDDE